MSEVKHTFLKCFRGKKLEGEHGVWFGGEWEEREWFVWLISLIWQDKGISEAVLGKMWANPWEALPSGAWSTGEPRSTACDKGVGEHCRLRIWADCPRTGPQKLPETGFSKKFVVCVFTLSECYDTIYVVPWDLGDLGNSRLRAHSIFTCLSAERQGGLMWI